MYKYLLITTILLAISSCSNLTKQKKKIYKWPKFEISNTTVSPGHIRKITIPYQKQWSNVRLFCNKKELKIFIHEKMVTAYISLSYKEENKSLKCIYKITQGKQTKKIKILTGKITPFNYPSRTLTVKKKHVSLSDKNIKRWLKEKAMQEKIYASGAPLPYFSKSFIRPLRSKVTSPYGSKRVFNGKLASWHSGVDLRAPMKTPVPAANRGKVVYTGELFFNGNAVIIDHGAGIFTMYCHLSKFKSKAGDLVNRGSIIALSGNTGRSTAPHLHWGTKVQDHWIDGRLLEKINKKVIHIKLKI